MESQKITLFDTDVTIDLLHKNPDIVDFANQLGRANIFINSIIKMEVLYRNW